MSKKLKSSWSKAAGIGIMLMLGTAFGYAIGLLATKGNLLPVNNHMRPEGIGEMLWLAVVFVIALWLVLAIHELGHLLAGLAQGFRFGLYIAGPLGARNEGGATKWFLNTDFQSFGGLAATLPRRFDEPRLTHKFAWVVAAGPLSSLIWAVLAFGLAWWIEKEAVQASITTKTLVCMFSFSGLFSTIIFAVTAFPIRTKGGFMSDGARMMSLLRGGPSAAFEQAILSSIGLLAEGKRYGEFPEPIIEQLAVSADSTVMELGALSTTMLHHLEQGRPDLAESFAHRLAAGLEDSPVFIQHAYGRELVFYFAFFEQKEAEAEAWRARIGPYAEKQADATWYRIKAALAILHGRLDEARQALDQAKTLLPKLMLSGLQRSETHWIERLEARLQSINHGHQA
ncbi:MAG: M50 family metallopeptidase [Saprospiraceae bacterium]